MQTNQICPSPASPASSPISDAERNRRVRARQRCTRGLHNPHETYVDAHNADVKRAKCRDCGSQLVRTIISRGWCFSGQLG